MKIESQYTIKNCPFCNSQGNLYKLGSRAYVVRCENPACKAEQVVFSCEEAVVQMWNKRPVTPERPIIDKIRAEIEQEITYKPMEMWDYRMGLTKALEIINKCKAEGGDK